MRSPRSSSARASVTFYKLIVPLLVLSVSSQYMTANFLPPEIRKDLQTYMLLKFSGRVEHREARALLMPAAAALELPRAGQLMAVMFLLLCCLCLRRCSKSFRRLSGPPCRATCTGR